MIRSLVTIARFSGMVLITLAAVMAFEAGTRRPIEPRATPAPDVERSGVPRLLVFRSEHCPACRAMEPVLSALEHACRSNRWALMRIDVDRPENASAVERFAIRALPTISLVDVAGQETSRLVGYQSEDRLRDVLRHGVDLACADPGAASDTPDEATPACEVGRTC